MGIYLNSFNAYTLYKNETAKPYFVDKSQMLIKLFPLIDQGSHYICITRPRRFGKTVMANMVSSFLAKIKDSHLLFDNLKVSESEGYEEHINKHNVIHIRFNEAPAGCRSYQEYISRINNRLLKDLCQAYPDIGIQSEEAAWDALLEIHEYAEGEQFIFILDEWDYIFHRDYVTDADKKDYIDFLCCLLKDKAYVSLAYMTGILPIAKYSSGSELNIFAEFTMAKSPEFSDFFGFTESETDDLYKRHLLKHPDSDIKREDLQHWYDGYYTASGERVYNPMSVVYALQYNHLENYWTSSGPYDEIFYYIEKNIADVRNDIALMISGIPVPAKIREYAATSMRLRTRDEIFSAMVVYGFLSYENGFVSIPNRELMDKFDDMLCKEPALGYVHRLALKSEQMLSATLHGDTKTMTEILEYAHHTETPLLDYNNETELTAIVNLVYLAARDIYHIEREDKSGTGYVDFIFYPKDSSADHIILELKVDQTADEAIRQIKEKKYPLRFCGKLAEQKTYTGRLLLVGIAYDRKTKTHSCKIEIAEK